MAQESYAQTFIDLFDDRIEDSEKEKRELSSTEKDQISGTFPDADKLGEALPELLAKVEGFNKSIDNASEKIKQWQDTKKMWQARLAQLLDVLGTTMERLHIPGKSLKIGGIKLSTRTGSVLEVDDDWLLQQYQAMADALQSQLPSYVKVKLAIDKTKLNAHIAKDDSLLVNHPDKIHTKPTSSTTLKK